MGLFKYSVPQAQARRIVDQQTEGQGQHERAKQLALTCNAKTDGKEEPYQVCHLVHRHPLTTGEIA